MEAGAMGRGRLPLGLLGMLAGVLPIEAFVAAHPERFVETSSMSWSVAAQDARSVAPGRQVLLLGDSQMKFGVVPEIVRAGSGRTVYNLAAPQAPAVASYLLF